MRHGRNRARGAATAGSGRGGACCGADSLMTQILTYAAVPTRRRIPRDGRDAGDDGGAVSRRPLPGGAGAAPRGGGAGRPVARLVGGTSGAGTRGARVAAAEILELLGVQARTG